MEKTSLPATERVTIVKVEPSEGYWQFLIPSENKDIKLSTILEPADTQANLAGKVYPLGMHPASLKEYFQGVFSALYELRNKGGVVEEARQFIETSMRENYPNTLTRIVYNPKGQKDAVIHNFGTNTPEEIPIDFAGANTRLSEMPLETCLALTGKNPQETEEIMSYLSNRALAYLWRLNSKPNQRTERVASFGANSGRASLSCDFRLTDYRWPAFRVSSASASQGASIAENKQGEAK